MSWNYRIFKEPEPLYKNEEGQDVQDYAFGIKEVYYNDETNELEGCSENFVHPVGNDLEDLKGELNNMLLALDKPILSKEDFK